MIKLSVLLGQNRGGDEDKKRQAAESNLRANAINQPKMSISNQAQDIMKKMKISKELMKFVDNLYG